jgi:hypothetical protein
MRLIRGIWTLSRTIAIGEGSISDLGEATLYIFLCIIFGIAAVVLLLFGINLDTADRWLDAHSAWFVWAFIIAFKGVMAFVFFLCVVAIGLWIYGGVRRLVHPRKPIKTRVSRRGRRPKQTEDQPVDSDDGQRVGWVGAICAFVIGYFAYFALTMPSSEFFRLVGDG